MHQRNDSDDRIHERPGDDDDNGGDATARPANNALPLASLVLALLGIPVVKGLDRIYQLVTDSPTLITRNSSLLLIPAIAAAIAIGCMLLKRYRRPQSMMVLVFALFIACFWLGAGLILFSFPARVAQ